LSEPKEEGAKEIAWGNPSAETRSLFPEDILLRRHGFKISSRPKYGPAVWARGGDRYEHSKALAIAKDEACVARKRGGR
jgi:hypothetical protein